MPTIEEKNRERALLMARLAQLDQPAAAPGCEVPKANCGCGGSGMRDMAQMLAEAINAGSDMPCGELPRKRTGPDGCVYTICRREQALSNVSIAGGGGTETVTVTPPAKAVAISFHTTQTTDDIIINSVVIGTRTVVQGPIPLARFNAQNAFDAKVGWGKFSSTNMVNISLTNNGAAAVDSASLASLVYRSEEE